MAATINGKPSVFHTPEMPVPLITDFQTHFAEQVSSAVAMAEDVETDWLNDPETIAELNAWNKSLETPEAQAQYDAWVTEQERAELDEHLCSQYDAEAAELAELGEAGLAYIAGHDAVWQAGGQI